MWTEDTYTFKLKVKPGKTYLLRLINAALNDELFFSIANHTLTVVDVDAIYVKPFETNTILITPGQTSNVLLKTKSYYPNATFLMSARPYKIKEKDHVEVEDWRRRGRIDISEQFHRIDTTDARSCKVSAPLGRFGHKASAGGGSFKL
ncbi:hypothetical protein RIF29_13951 [Crotalaria pallida]|uniref:Plastocyanin-like domain-containing protein n=1 Tax=Crotalaria pallida TaxID=3830 RepID=A0AAN9FAW3_CROPI